ncbi:hypothetical protein M8818_006879 [Zalaria obscura]|uniref:Uncharacterized protein n=1 Tax=Zalaria obscura TaxID=2024903 RepID=A0ACC3S697_9PEZI
MSKTEEEYGWTAVPRSLAKLVASRENKQSPKPIKIEEIPLPDSPLVQSVLQYAKENLPRETFHHSMRIFYYGTVTASRLTVTLSHSPNTLPGQAITTQYFPSWRYDPATYLLTCLLHDIGTTPSNQSSTSLSFEFFGGYLVLDLLKSLHAPVPQAELVAEAIIRHQDLGETGMQTTVGAITHFSTIFDNAGGNAELVHEETIRSVVAKWPREKWTGCFAHVVREEKRLKPWSHTTKIEGFEEMVEGNTVMEPYD